MTLSPITIRDPGATLRLPDDLPFKDWCRIGVDLAKAERGLNWLIGEWWAFGQHHYSDRLKATKANWWKERGLPPFDSCATYAKIARVFSGDWRYLQVSFNHHQEVTAIARKDMSLAQHFLHEAHQNGWTVKQLREAVFRYKSRANRKSPDDGCTIDDLNVLIASGKRFSVIYVDPPWTFEVFGALGKDRSAEKHYETMSLDQIKALPFGQLADENCVLLMWAIWPELPGALEVIEAWGFEYKTAGFIWAKQNQSGEGWFTGLGYWTRANTEPCLLSTRGTPKRIERDVSQLIVTPISDHSRKPTDAYERIEQLLSGPYIELFARERRAGWWAWGDEIPTGQMAAE